MFAGYLRFSKGYLWSVSLIRSWFGSNNKLSVWIHNLGVGLVNGHCQVAGIVVDALVPEVADEGFHGWSAREFNPLVSLDLVAYGLRFHVVGDYLVEVEGVATSVLDIEAQHFRERQQVGSHCRRTPMAISLAVKSREAHISNLLSISYHVLGVSFIEGHDV